MIFQLLKKFFSASLPKEVNHILVVREAAIGDVLCMTPFLKALRENYPKATIDFVVVEWAKSVIENNPNISNIITVSNELVFGNNWKVAFKRLLFFATSVKKNYDLVFCPSTQLLIKLILVLYRKAYKIGFSCEHKEKATKFNFMLNDYVYIDIKEIPRTRHIAIRNLEMLDLILDQKVGRNFGLEIFSTTKDAIMINEWLENLNWKGKKVIAIALTAGNAVKSDSLGKTAPKEIFISILNILKVNTDNRFILIGAASEYDYAESLDIADGKVVINCCGKFTLSQSAELLNHCHLLISNDSGATHLASAKKINNIVFFGGTDDIEFGPYQNTNATVYRVSLPCAPCRASSCLVDTSEYMKDHKRPYCLSMIDPAKVAFIADQKLRGKMLNSNYYQEVKE